MSLLHKKMIFWFTGLSGAGKSTLANKLLKHLLSNGYKTILLDGDNLRENYHRKLDFTREGIITNNELIIQKCKMLLKDFDFIIVSVIAPFYCTRKRARAELRHAYKEIYLKVTLETVRARDVKGLYKKALNGEISNFIGIDKNTPYQIPIKPDIIIDTENESIEGSYKILIEKIFN